LGHYNLESADGAFNDSILDVFWPSRPSKMFLRAALNRFFRETLRQMATAAQINSANVTKPPQIPTIKKSSSIVTTSDSLL